MPTLLIRNAALLASFDDAGSEFTDAGLFARDGVIEALGPTASLPDSADRVIDLRDHLVLPGLVNTHHHLYQSLTRVIAQQADLFTWLQTLYPIWARLTDEAVYVSTLTGLAELALSGCTTSSDHLYLFPNDCTLDSQIRAAGEIGLRFHAARGAMSLGESRGGLPPDRVTEDEAAILRDSQRLIEAYHDPSPLAMIRIVLAPCSPFSVTPDLMRETAAMGRHYGVRLHTHLAETPEEEAFCLQRFGQRPVAYAESLGWTGEDVWHAHCVHLDGAECELFGRTGTGVAHCPSSNQRLASGIAPLRRLAAHAVPIGLGVDGSASNDAGHLLGEARAAMLLQRTAPDPARGGSGAGNPAALSARQALHLATRGGARVLGREDIGHLAPGMAADLIAIDLNRIEFAGALHDPLAALALCRVERVDWNIVGGRVVVEQGRLPGIQIRPLLARHNRLSRRMINGD